MRAFINIRGTNGSGKSTLARSFFPNGLELHLINDPSRKLLVVGQMNLKGDVLVGRYPEDPKKIGGLDTIRAFDIQREAIRRSFELGTGNVFAEGILCSTVFGSWATFADEMASVGRRVLWAYLDTPVEECLRRIQVRNGGQPIKEDLVRDKVRAIEATKKRALAHPSISVAILGPTGEEKALIEKWLAS
jgi:predicted ABC-type ATPase